jgi:hypothetical protein
MRIVVLLAAALATPAFAEEATQLSAPEGAKGLREDRILDGRAHQTSFTLEVRYPIAPAFEHYSKQLGAPWVECEWIPQWQSFGDHTMKPPRRVHQQATIWINPKQRRTLMVMSRYYSSIEGAGNPEYDTQHVVVVEYFGQDVKQHVESLKLKCPR